MVTSSYIHTGNLVASCMWIYNRLSAWILHNMVIASVTQCTQTSQEVTMKLFRGLSNFTHTSVVMSHKSNSHTILCLCHKGVSTLPMDPCLNIKDANMEKASLSYDITTEALMKWSILHAEVPMQVLCYRTYAATQVVCKIMSSERVINTTLKWLG